MHKPVLANRMGRWLAAAAFGLLATTGAHAQLAGPKAIPGDYATIAAAVTALNAQGVGAGGVTFDIAAGYTETGNVLITATGTAVNPIVFRKAGTGANPLLSAGVGTTATLDAIIGLSGSDYVTFDGLDVAESAANASATTKAEFGYALFRASATDGCQNNVIRNCVVTLDKTNSGTIGIYGAATAATAVAAVTASAPAGANASNRVYGNVVTNALNGIYFNAASATTAANYDQSNEVGSVISPATAATGNVIGNFGGSATGAGIYGAYQNGLKIQGNTVNSTLNYTSATTSTAVAPGTVTGTLYGVYTPSGTATTLDITGNTVTLASGATTSTIGGIYNSMSFGAAGSVLTISGNTLSLSCTTATSALAYVIYNSVSSASPATLTISNNTSTSSTLSTTGSVYMIYNNHSAAATNVVGNQFSGLTRTGTSGSTYGYYNNGSGAGTQTLTNNVFNNFTLAGSGTFYGFYNTSSSSETQLWSGNQITNITGSGTGTLYGIYDTYGTVNSAFFNNTITGLSGGGTVYGLFLSNSSLVQAAAYGNTVGGLSSSGASSTVYGIYTASLTTPTVYRNKVYDLSASGATAAVYGLYNTGGTTITYHNNLVGDLRAPASTGLNAVVGLFISAGTTVNTYYNTIYLNASSTGATFGTSGIYLGSTTSVLDLRNNVVVNKSTAAGTGGVSAALRRVSGTAGTAPANLGGATNNNLYYAGTPSATSLIYVEGITATQTNAQQTLATYKALVGSRETGSVTEDAPFISTTGTAATFLHISTTTPTQVESGGQAIAGITTDFDGDTRNAGMPDIGADEGTFQLLDISGPVIAYAALAGTASTANRTLTVTVTDPSGVATGTNAPRLYFRKGATGAFVFVNATLVSGSTYAFTFDYTLVGGVASGDAIQYYVAAQDLVATPNGSTSPVGGNGVTPPGTTLPASVNQFTILNGLSGTYYVGTSTSPQPTRTYATLTAAASAYSSSGLTGAVTFLLLDPAYSAATGETFPVAFFNNGDASATNTLTIKPNTGNTATVTAAGSVLALASTRYLTIDGSNTAGGTTRDLTFTNTALTASSYVIGLLGQTGQAQNNQFTTIRNVNVVGGGATANATLGILLNGADNDNVTLQNNSILGVTTGIQAFGTALVSAGGLDNLVITGNIVGPATATAGSNINNTGILISSVVSPTVTNNTVQNVTSATAVLGLQVQSASTATITGNSVLGVVSTGAGATGMGLFANTGSTFSQNLVQGLSGNSSTSLSVGLIVGNGNTGVVIDRNRFLGLTEVNTGGNGVKGIEVQTSATNANVRISNNFVQVTAASGFSGTTYSNSGIRLSGTQSGISLYYNSVNLTGTDVYNTTSQSAALTVLLGSTGLDVRNNIFRNQVVNSGNTGAKAYALYSTAPASAFTALNYNDYFATGNQAVLAYFNADVTSLADLRTATTMDANSLSVDPQFTSATDLHAAAPALNGAATPLAAVTQDIDGTTRSTTPDIGADEFVTNLDIAVAALVSPTPGNSCFGSTEAVTVSIRNASTATLDFAVNPVTVTVTITPPGVGATPVTFTTTVNTGTLAANTAQNVTLTGTADLSAAGAYAVTVTTSLTGDDNVSNNTLAPALTITNAPRSAGFTYAGATGTICAGSTTTLTPTLGTGATAGTFSSTTGLTINATTGVVNPATSTAGTYVITNTLPAANGCPVTTATQSITIVPVAVATFSYGTATSFCLSGTTSPTVALGTGATAGTFTSTTGLTINATTGAITLASSTAGTYTVTNTVAASGTACGNTATTTVTLVAAPLASFSYATASTCAGNTATLTPTLGTGATAGTFSSTTGLTINATTGVVNPATSTAGTYVVTNTIAAAGGCAAATATSTVTINALPATPTVTLTYPSATTALLTSSVAPAGATYQWFLNGTAITGATGQTYTITTPVAVGAYTVRLTFTATGCQSAPSSVTTITAARQALAGTSLRLFPNPTADGRVSVELSGYAKAVQLTVLDALGRVVLTQQVAAGQSQAQLDLSGQASGVYLLRATTEGGTDVRRIVRQ